jgi:hypothetical protein
MKFWQSISWAEAEQLTGIARFAEQAGFHGVIKKRQMERYAETIIRRMQ